MQFPAGLIDAGESAAEAALRELKEETGYAGTVVEVSPVCYSDPGMSNANMQFAVVAVDASAPDNMAISPELEVRLLKIQRCAKRGSDRYILWKWCVDLQLKPYLWGQKTRQILCTHVAKNDVLPCMQEGEYIEVFLLPVCGLYDALLVRSPAANLLPTSRK